MFKFVKGHMETIAGVEIFPIISLLIFFIFFVILFCWVFSAGKDYLKTMGEIPFEPDNDQKL